MIQFHGFFKNQRRFHRNQRARNHSAGELLQADPAPSQPFAERDFGKRAQGAKIADSPQVESFQKARGFLGRSAEDLRAEDDARLAEDSEREQELDAARRWVC